MVKHANKKLEQAIKSQPSTPRDVAPDQYYWYVPSFRDSWIGSALNRQPRWVAKGSYSIKGLASTEDSSRAMDPEIKKLVENSLDKHED